MSIGILSTETLYEHVLDELGPWTHIGTLVDKNGQVSTSLTNNDAVKPASSESRAILFYGFTLE